MAEKTPTSPDATWSSMEQALVRTPESIVDYKNARVIFNNLTIQQKKSLQSIIGTFPDGRFGNETYWQIKKILGNTPVVLQQDLTALLNQFIERKNTIQESTRNMLLDPNMMSPTAEFLQSCERELPKILSFASDEIGTTERSWAASKYFLDAGFGRLDARRVPWCAAFVNWVLQKNGYPWSYSLSAKSFIGQSGSWHVGFKDGLNILGGNQSNMVSSVPAQYFPPVVWYAIPTPHGLQSFPAKKFEEIPNWAIVVCGRSWRNKNLV